MAIRKDKNDAAWAKVVEQLGLQGNPYQARYLWTTCSDCGKTKLFGEIVGMAAVQDDGSFNPSLQVEDKDGQQWWVRFGGDALFLEEISGKTSFRAPLHFSRFKTKLVLA